MDQLFDPFNLPGDQAYGGSAYQQMDRILAGVYAYYGYDLKEVAANRQDNPVAEAMFFDYLVITGRIYVTETATMEQFSSYEWLQRRLGMGAGGVVCVLVNGVLSVCFLSCRESRCLLSIDRSQPEGRGLGDKQRLRIQQRLHRLLTACPGQTGQGSIGG